MTCFSRLGNTKPDMLYVSLEAKNYNLRTADIIYELNSNQLVDISKRVKINTTA